MAHSILERIPYWSDLNNEVSKETQTDWDDRQAHLALLEQYFRGEIFTRRIEDPDAEDETPLLYPVGANLAKTLCLSMADSLFGEWDESVVKYEPARTVDVNDTILKGIHQMENILRASRANSRLWEIELDRNKFGGAILKINAGFTEPHFVTWSRVQGTEFYPVVDPIDEEKFLAAKVISHITREQARMRFDYEGDDDSVQVEEIWDLKSYNYVVGGKRIEEYSGQNPFGIVPFVYIPRFRSSSWWGDSLIDDVRMVQDELNARLADLGEAINFNAHPTRWGVNLPRKFNAKNYPLGANVLWDLGRAFAGAPQPQVGILEATNPIPQGSFDFIKWIYDWARTSVFAPPIAFGEDNGGGQRSGVTLEIRLWPLIKSVRRSRSYMITGLSRAMELSARILEQKKVLPKEVLHVMRDGSIVPSFSAVMPRDQAALVDEVVKRLSTHPPTVSLTEALKILGSPASEEQEIMKMMDEIQKRSTAQLKAVSDAGNHPPHQEKDND